VILRPCSQPGCPVLVVRGRCPQHERAENHRRATKAQRHGLHSVYWRGVRLARLQMDGWRCVLMVDEGCTGYAETVHLDPELRGNHLLATVDNVRSACRHCHGVVDAPRSHRSQNAL